MLVSFTRKSDPKCSYFFNNIQVTGTEEFLLWVTRSSKSYDQFSCKNVFSLIRRHLELCFRCQFLCSFIFCTFLCLSDHHENLENFKLLQAQIYRVLKKHPCTHILISQLPATRSGLNFYTVFPIQLGGSVQEDIAILRYFSRLRCEKYRF